MLDAIPFEMPNQIPFVVMQGEAGDARPVRVLLDTGNAAPFAMIVSPDLAARAGAAATGAPDTRSAAALGDSAVPFRPARLPSFTLGPIVMRDLPVGISPAVEAVARQLNSPIDAILGHRFVAGRTISIDYARRQVDFEAAAGPAGRAIPFTLAPGRPLTLVRVTVNGRGPFLMVLDSGASTSLVSPATAAAAGVEAGRNVQLGGAGGVASGGARLGRARISLGTLSRDGQPVAVADVFAPISAAAGAPVEGVLGADMFGAGRITLDYGTNRLWFDETGRGD